MKNIFIISALIFTTVIYSQSPILPLSKAGDAKPGAYYKDLNNELDILVGTWIYTNGNTSLTITLQKKVMAHITIDGLDFYEDTVIGEYKYIENGAIKINTLSRLQNNLNVDDYSILGHIILSVSPYVIWLSLKEDGINITGLQNAMYFQRVDVGGVQKLKLNFKMSSAPVSVNGVMPQTTYTLPYGEYILTKQP